MEIELKLQGATADLFRSVGDSLGPYRLGAPRIRVIVDLYFDTEALDLARRSSALRRREEEGRAYFTLKLHDSHAGAVVRREEIEVAATEVNWRRLTARAAAYLTDGAGLAAGAAPPRAHGAEAGAPVFAPVLTVRNRRVERQVLIDGKPVAMAAFDQVDYGDGETFFDIEFELAEGREEVHLDRLAACFPALQPQAGGKLARGLRRAGRQPYGT
jgi:inorganic triphosphatase YgiF